MTMHNTTPTQISEQARELARQHWGDLSRMGHAAAIYAAIEVGLRAGKESRDTASRGGRCQKLSNHDLVGR